MKTDAVDAASFFIHNLLARLYPDAAIAMQM